MVICNVSFHIIYNEEFSPYITKTMAHNGTPGVRNNRRLDCMFDYAYTTTKSLKISITGHLWGKSAWDRCVPWQKICNVENFPMSCRYHVTTLMADSKTVVTPLLLAITVTS